MLFVLLLNVFHNLIMIFLFIFVMLLILVDHVRCIRRLSMHHLLLELIILVLLCFDAIFYVMLLLRLVVGIHPMYHIFFSIFLSLPFILFQYFVLFRHFRMNLRQVFLLFDISTYEAVSMKCKIFCIIFKCLYYNVYLTLRFI